jgi:hypothetical protein
MFDPHRIWLKLPDECPELLSKMDVPRDLIRELTGLRPETSPLDASTGAFTVRVKQGPSVVGE